MVLCLTLYLVIIPVLKETGTPDLKERLVRCFVWYLAPGKIFCPQTWCSFQTIVSTKSLNDTRRKTMKEPKIHERISKKRSKINIRRNMKEPPWKVSKQISLERGLFWGLPDLPRAGLGAETAGADGRGIMRDMFRQILQWMMFGSRHFIFFQKSRFHS